MAGFVRYCGDMTASMEIGKWCGRFGDLPVLSKDASWTKPSYGVLKIVFVILESAANLIEGQRTTELAAELHDHLAQWLAVAR